MEKKNFRALLFSAFWCLSVSLLHQYYFVNENKTWNEARSYCRQNYGDLATIRNKEEMENLSNTLNEKVTGKIWIGLKRVNDKGWRWSVEENLGNKYSKWCAYSPNQNELTETCVYMRDLECWTDTDCVTLKNFVCYDGTEQEKYKVISQQLSWCDARRYCREHHTHLAIVRNQDENRKIWKVMKGSNISTAWIGLFNTSWEWSDASDSCFRKWGANQPKAVSGHCAMLSVTGQNPIQSQYEVLNCEEKLRFVCHNDLILVNQNRTWIDALFYCRQNQADLVSITTKEIQHLVTTLIQNASTEHVWLGLRYACGLGFWFWVSGESVCYQKWAKGNRAGHEDCSHGDRSGAVQSRENNSWVSLTGDQQLNFICYIN